MVMPDGIGPVLVPGPVEVVLADGSVRVSSRPRVALCTCGRSGCYPFCDTSHRRRSRPPRDTERASAPTAAAGSHAAAGSRGEPGRAVREWDAQ